MKEILKRINELAAIAKDRELTEDELRERDFLRARYIKAFRDNLKDTLMNTTILDEHGNDVTPEKLKREQFRIKRGKDN